ncbi:MAG: SpaA isopeptide-forming pilin-related protein [Acidobacteriota bacterium]|nr:SpaA isopeptide-forming pilin-related protein [Acidobacteriota bacterium]
MDAEDNSSPLAGAVFEVERSDGTTFLLTTGTNGTVTSGALTPGTYKVREILPPTGYVADGGEHTLVVSAEAGALLTVTNEPIRTSVSVTKKWIGPEGTAVVVYLLADGSGTGRTLTLSAANNWEGSFDGLRLYMPDGKKIEYT